MFSYRHLFQILLCFGLPLLIQPAQATSGIVTNCTTYNDNTGIADTLGELLPGGGNITFACSGTIVVPEIVIGTNTTLDATGQSVTLKNNTWNRVLKVDNNVTAALTGLTISDGRADSYGYMDGGGICNYGTLTLTNVMVSDNYADRGGGIYNAGTLTLINSTVFKNHGRYMVNGSGAGIYNSGTAIITGSTVSNNFSVPDSIIGGGIANAGNLEISNSSFTYNWSDFGGGITNSGGTVFISHTDFSHNSSLTGGAILNEKDGIITIEQSTLSINYAYDGGGIFNDDAGTVIVSKSTLSGNFADGGNGNGGGIYNTGSSVTITDSIFEGNYTKGKYDNNGGGGIYNLKGSVIISSSTFFGNYVSYHDGGGIYNSDKLSLNNSTLSGNTAQQYGGGIYNTGTLELTYSTFSNNSASQTGESLYNAAGTTILTNSLFDNANSRASCVNNATLNLVGANLIEDGSCGAPLSGDPKLGPLENNGGTTFTHILLLSSPALDVATGNCPPTDQRQYSRPQGAGCDLGAVESNYWSRLTAPNSEPERNILLSNVPTLTWNAITWATGYKIQISRNATFEASSYIFTDEVGADKLTYTLPSDQALSDGKYYWRVCAKQNNGLCGNWSLSESFLVDLP